MKVQWWNIDHIKICHIQRNVNFQIGLLICWSRWKCDDVALQAGDIPNMWMGFSTLMNVIAFPGQIRVMVLAGVENAVVRIQTFGAIRNGMLTSEVFLICNEHLEVMFARFLVYKPEVQVGGFASGWKGVGMVKNCPFVAWQIWNWWDKSSTAIDLSLVISRHLVAMPWWAVKFPCGISKVKIS